MKLRLRERVVSLTTAAIVSVVVERNFFLVLVLQFMRIS